MKKIISKLSILLVGLIFAGCNVSDEPEKPKYTIPGVGERVKLPIQTETVVTVPPKLRFDLKKVQTFYDSDAYYGVRNVYVLTDSETGKEFVGVSGIGITELGSHINSKNTYQDER